MRFIGLPSSLQRPNQRKRRAGSSGKGNSDHKNKAATRAQLDFQQYKKPSGDLALFAAHEI
jgi:hypothetical protein